MKGRISCRSGVKSGSFGGHFLSFQGRFPTPVFHSTPCPIILYHSSPRQTFLFPNGHLPHRRSAVHCISSLGISRKSPQDIYPQTLTKKQSIPTWLAKYAERM